MQVRLYEAEGCADSRVGGAQGIPLIHGTAGGQTHQPLPAARRPALVRDSLERPTSTAAGKENAATFGRTWIATRQTLTPRAISTDTMDYGGTQ